MNVAAAFVYCAIVVLWLAVLATVIIAYVRNPRTFGTTRLLLAVLAIDTLRNIVENLYFGLYWGAQYGVFPSAIVEILGKPHLLIIPKVINIIAACVVLGVLLLRWLPMASRERTAADESLLRQSTALTQEILERRRLFETSLDLILITDRQGKLVRVSPSSAATVGYTPEEMVGRSSAKFVRADDLEATQREIRLAHAGRPPQDFEASLLHKDGRTVPMAWSGVWSEPEQRHYFVGRDMTGRKAAEQELDKLAHYDQLTGLRNRLTLSRDLKELLASNDCREGLATAIALLDLEGIKEVNDTIDHSTGDQLLQQVAQRLTELAGDAARVYRLGDASFVVSFPDCGDPCSFVPVVNTMLKRLAEPCDVNGHRLLVSASAGIAIAPADGSTVDELIANADLALHDAKAAGGRTSRLFLPVLRARAQARRELDLDLCRAFADKEFVLYYQPQLRMSDGALVGAEALLRWKHPKRGIIAPGAFIEALGASPVALEAGTWILQTACHAASAWRAKGHSLRVAVNLFPAQIRCGTLLKDVETALTQSGLSPSDLELEITENVALDHDEATIAQLRALRAKGVGIAFDDFGTGYASLSNLARYPLSRIKIDQGFIRKITDQSTSDDTTMVRSIIALAHGLGLEAIAEGVETSVQAAFLKAEHCEEVQGFLYAKPLPATELEAFAATTASNSHTEAASCPPQGDAEEQRLQALYSYQILDTPAEQSFDRITRLARLFLDAPMATVTLVDRHRQWFKSRLGLAAEETPREISFCTHTVRQDEPFIVEDALSDPRFRNSPLVTGEPRVRAYIGVPLRSPGGHNIGALCVMDIKPRTISTGQIDVLRDLARLVVDELELRKLAFVDSLTGAMTRRAFLVEADREVRRAKRHHRSLGCIIFDLDHFKSINDTYGHAAGDSVLAQVVAACKEKLRSSDHIGRLGGEEFAILLPETATDTRIVAESLRHKISSLAIEFASTTISVSASFGVADLTHPDADFNAILLRADCALYQAKDGGRNRVAHIECPRAKSPTLAA